MKLRTRFFLGFLAVGVVTAILGITALQVFGSLNRECAVVQQDVMPGAVSMLETEAAVQSLAEQSRQARTHVEAILSDIQRATNMTVMATEEGTKGVEEGVTLSTRTGDVIWQLCAALTQSAQAAVRMVAVGQQQTSGIEQIALAMQNINQATVQSLASTRQAEKAERDMNELACSLQETVERYK